MLNVDTTTPFGLTAKSIEDGMVLKSRASKINMPRQIDIEAHTRERCTNKIFTGIHEICDRNMVSTTLNAAPLRPTLPYHTHQAEVVLRRLLHAQHTRLVCVHDISVSTLTKLVSQHNQAVHTLFGVVLCVCRRACARRAVRAES